MNLIRIRCVRGDFDGSGSWCIRADVRGDERIKSDISVDLTAPNIFQLAYYGMKSINIIMILLTILNATFMLKHNGNVCFQKCSPPTPSQSIPTPPNFNESLNISLHSAQWVGILHSRVLTCSSHNTLEPCRILRSQTTTRKIKPFTLKNIKVRA